MVSMQLLILVDIFAVRVTIFDKHSHKAVSFSVQNKTVERETVEISRKDQVLDVRFGFRCFRNCSKINRF